MLKRYALTGGMNEVLPAESLPDDTAVLIQNMRIGDDGSWSAVIEPIPRSTGAHTFPPHTYAWEPVYMPTGATGTTIYVCFSDAGDLFILNDGITEDTYLLSGIDTANLRVSYDAQQFVFVDGREGRGAQRITINSEGVISCRRFGTQQPTTFPEVKLIDNARYEDGKYTGMPVGSILYYCYCIVNEYGERSNPSPVVVCDTAQWLAKGELIQGGDYEYSDVNGGSIKSVTVGCAIPAVNEGKRIELYRASAEYFEGEKPLDPLRLVKSAVIPEGWTSIDITDTAFASAIETDYENDSAPAGDDIVLDSGTIFIANAVTESAFAYPVEKVWKITLTNDNAINYANRWIAIDIRDENSPGTLCNFDGLADAGALFANALSNRHRFIDTDMITPLTAWGTPTPVGGAVFRFTDPHDSVSKAYRQLFFIQIPYIQANTDKIIYLVEYVDAHSTYGNCATQIPQNGTPATAEFTEWEQHYDNYVNNPVRDSDCVLAVGKVSSVPASTDGWQGDFINKANALWAREMHSTATEIPATYMCALPPVIPIGRRIKSNIHNMQFINSDPNTSSMTYDRQSNMAAHESGYFYIHVASQSHSATATPLVKLTFNDSGTNGQLMLYVNRDVLGWLQIRVTGKSGTGVFPQLGELSINTGNSGLANYSAFIMISWQNGIDASSGQIETTLTIGAIVSSYYGTKYGISTETNTNGALSNMESPKLQFAGLPSSGSPIQFSIARWYLNIAEYIDSLYEIAALARYDTHYPTSPIGIRDHTIYEDASAASGLLTNNNVTIEPMLLTNEKKPGKIRWSNGGAIPDLYERNVFTEIMRILPIKSFMPTDEHNTLLIWTKDKLLRMSLVGNNKESSALITELNGTGLQDRDSLCAITDGVVWSERNGIYLMTQGGLKDIGSQRVLDGDYRIVYDYRNQEVLFFQNDNAAYVYNLKWDAWSTVYYPEGALNLIEYAGLWCVISTDGIYELDTPGEATLTPLIKTKKYHAKPKLRRLTLHSTGGTAYAKVWNHRLTGGNTTTATYTLTADTPKAIPQLSGDYVQFFIDTDNLKTLDIEDANGN